MSCKGASTCEWSTAEGEWSQAGLSGLQSVVRGFAAKMAVEVVDIVLCSGVFVIVSSVWCKNLLDQSITWYGIVLYSVGWEVDLAPRRE